MIRVGKVHPEKLIARTITLEDSLHELVAMDEFAGTGILVIDEF